MTQNPLTNQIPEDVWIAYDKTSKAVAKQMSGLDLWLKYIHLAEKMIVYEAQGNGQKWQCRFPEYEYVWNACSEMAVKAFRLPSTKRPKILTLNEALNMQKEGRDG